MLQSDDCSVLFFIPDWCFGQGYFSGTVRGYKDGYLFGTVGAFGTLLFYGGHGWWHSWWYCCWDDLPTFLAQDNSTVQRAVP